MQIIKQDGSKQSFKPNKILTRIKNQASNLDVDCDKVFQKAINGVVDGMTTAEIDRLLADKANELILEDLDYTYLASRIMVTRHAKVIGVSAKPEDFNFDYFGFNSFLFKYSLRNDKKEPIELPHMMYERVCNHLYSIDEYPKENKELYTSLINKEVSLATPQLTNAGVEKRNNLMSCETHSLVEDSKEGIHSTLAQVGNSSSAGSGIGLQIHPLRSAETLVSSFQDNAMGVVKFCKIVESYLEAFKQGKRAGRAAVYLGVWHRDIKDFLRLRLQIGSEKERTRDLFTAVCFPDLFYQKLMTNGVDDDWYTFCPHQVKLAGFEALHDVYDSEESKDWTNLYNQLVEAGLGKKESVQDIWFAHLRSLAESGTPYTWNWDVANRQNPQKNIGILRGYQLCIEFAGVSRPNYIAQCDLAAIALSTLKRKDWKELERRTRILVRSLNRAIDLNNWSNKASKIAGEDQRSIGIGILGLADYMAQHGVIFESEEAKEENEQIMKVIYTSAKDESHKMALEQGRCYGAWEGSDYHKESYEMLNSILVCLMPTASTAYLHGFSPQFEKREFNIVNNRIDAGEYFILNPYLFKDLKKLGLWNRTLANKILSNNGSVKGLKEVPEYLQEIHKTMREIKMKDFIDLAARRQKWIDQGQSMNLYFDHSDSAKMGSALIYAWKNNLPTGSYYTNCPSKLGNNAVRLSGAREEVVEKPSDSPFECFGCSV